tara:strand:- start:3129 stop:3548 length:420 start_codon:yes stop_codon:yes gene_type:complete
MYSRGFTMIEMVMVILLIGILAVVQLPRMERRLQLELFQIEKSFVNNLWAELEVYAKLKKKTTGTEKYPYNPLILVGRTRGYHVTLTEGLPVADNEWTFSKSTSSKPAIYHRRMNNEIWYYTYDSLNFVLAEYPLKLTL